MPDVIRPWQVSALAHDIAALASLGKYDNETRRNLRAVCLERIDSLNPTVVQRQELERLVRHAAYCA